MKAMRMRARLRNARNKSNSTVGHLVPSEVVRDYSLGGKRAQQSLGCPLLLFLV